ncbi:MAG: TRAP transporter small permease [Pseudoflavonifractor sp.]|nr:TRAP transporter small permease [Pseudoflavonifractor sp.]
MNHLGRVGRLLRDCVEVYLPSLSFIILFSVFLVGIFSRYLLNNPIPWSNEVVSICFLWMVLSGACYCQRRRSHVTFTMLYDALPPRPAAFSAFLGNAIILAALLLAFPSTVKFVRFMKVQKSSLLHISLSILYFPYLIFMILIAAYLVFEMTEQFRIFSGLGLKKGKIHGASGEEKLP